MVWAINTTPIDHLYVWELVHIAKKLILGSIVLRHPTGGHLNESRSGASLVSGEGPWLIKELPDWVFGPRVVSLYIGLLTRISKNLMWSLIPR